MRLITISDIQGQLARFAVKQHPYNRPTGLFDIIDLLGIVAVKEFKDGDPSLPMRWFNEARDIEVWLETVIGNHPIVLAWNKPKSGNVSEYQFVSRYNYPRPEDDFIDLFALLRNVSHAAWDDARECEKLAA